MTKFIAVVQNGATGNPFHIIKEHESKEKFHKELTDKGTRILGGGVILTEEEVSEIKKLTLNEYLNEYPERNGFLYGYLKRNL